MLIQSPGSPVSDLVLTRCLLDPLFFHVDCVWESCLVREELSCADSLFGTSDMVVAALK